MEVRNTPAEPLLTKRESNVLVEDLCVALRQVSVFNNYLPDGGPVREQIDAVKAISAELAHRGVDSSSAVRQLSTLTNVEMTSLLADCLAYPERIPYQRDLDGIRVWFRCRLCRTAEWPNGAQFWVCDACLTRTIHGVETGTSVPGLFLYRTVTESRRCTHAGSDTVLAAIDSLEDYWEEFAGFCAKCLADEKRRRT